MTFHSLHCHTANNMPSGIAVSAAAAWTPDGGLRLEYRLQGAIATLRVPPPAKPQATDGLWQHTCCEAFVAAAGEAAYREFNFSPSSRWAAYRFDAYRQRDMDWQPGAHPIVSLQIAGDCLRLLADIPASLLPETADLDLGLTVVIETPAGDKSYWALCHAGQQPDFHLRDSFTLPLTRP
ncbi:DOMON-like domain-containing protein [Dechloromonas sp. XY25]|uniref:DOMON-like domain-containing protein n=1 Tax=Dechloromonas hankyongensis TaxID=2908002 RepID=A0ABS9JWT6_9RHOO|nr:DOMON-like domain-containing protein [Dechloromonas hankyongensis]MCG2575380.1 DOMON-like domain-containing protein [Dechloromonas hankyongensis]